MIQSTIGDPKEKQPVGGLFSDFWIKPMAFSQFYQVGLGIGHQLVIGFFGAKTSFCQLCREILCAKDSLPSGRQVDVMNSAVGDGLA